MISWVRGHRKILWRLLGGGLCIAGGVTITLYHNVDLSTLKVLITLAVTVFPVLFGFSLTIIAIVGGLDAASSQLSWERLQIYKRTFESKIIRQCLLGVFYLCTLLCALFLSVVSPETPYYKWGCKIFLGVGATSLLFSFSMPFSLFYLFVDRYQLLLEQKGAPPIPDENS